MPKLEETTGCITLPTHFADEETEETPKRTKVTWQS